VGGQPVVIETDFSRWSPTWNCSPG